jgi:hypothetical protein
MHLKVKIGCTRSDYSSCTPQSCFGHDHGDLSHPRLERRYTPRLPQLPPASRSGAGRTASRTFLDLAIFEGDAPPRFAHPPYPRRIGTGQPSAIRFYPRSGRRRQRDPHACRWWESEQGVESAAPGMAISRGDEAAGRGVAWRRLYRDLNRDRDSIFFVLFFFWRMDRACQLLGGGLGRTDESRPFDRRVWTVKM